ncbi:hypothetical protein CEXT_19991 [Caerostris extrusa]|uniref:Uncharacterized protein n=1 Tax=Caerostris extrusa TaxID=172846 RepID=A0AAV4W409_CAEEX|nr:hypothetical protein CEXT_19991 [Caerostris extrusa]
MDTTDTTSTILANMAMPVLTDQLTTLQLLLQLQSMHTKAIVASAPVYSHKAYAAPAPVYSHKAVVAPAPIYVQKLLQPILTNPSTCLSTQSCHPHLWTQVRGSWILFIPPLELVPQHKPLCNNYEEEVLAICPKQAARCHIGCWKEDHRCLEFGSGLVN